MDANSHVRTLHASKRILSKRHFARDERNVFDQPRRTIPAQLAEHSPRILAHVFQQNFRKERCLYAYITMIQGMYVWMYVRMYIRNGVTVIYVSRYAPFGSRKCVLTTSHLIHGTSREMY